MSKPKNPEIEAYLTKDGQIDESNKQFDVVIKCLDGELKAHKHILEAFAPHFKDILESYPPKEIAQIIIPFSQHVEFKVIRNLAYGVNVREADFSFERLNTLIQRLFNYGVDLTQYVCKWSEEADETLYIWDRRIPKNDPILENLIAKADEGPIPSGKYFELVSYPPSTTIKLVGTRQIKVKPLYPTICINYSIGPKTQNKITINPEPMRSQNQSIANATRCLVMTEGKSSANVVICHNTPSTPRVAQTSKVKNGKIRSRKWRPKRLE